MTLFQSVDKLIENISVTDRQEDSIDCSFNNLKISLLKENSNLKIEDVFLNGHMREILSSDHLMILIYLRLSHLKNMKTMA